jgi:hypothetical protein
MFVNVPWEDHTYDLSPKLDKFGTGNVGTYNGNGSANRRYMRIATITTGPYRNYPVCFEITGRGIPFSEVEIAFNNSSSTDPGINYITTSNYGYFWIAKSATSTWELYAKLTESYGNINVDRVKGCGLANNVGVTMQMDAYGSSQPPGQQAERTLVTFTETNITYTNGVATIAKRTGYVLINVIAISRNDSAYGPYAISEQTDGSYRVRNYTTSLNASITVRLYWYKTF